MNNTTNVSISELRQKATQAVSHVVDKKEPIVILKRSKPQAVLVDFDYFNSLEEAVMDLTDAQEAQVAKKEKKTPFDLYIKKRWKSSL